MCFVVFSALFSALFMLISDASPCHFETSYTVWSQSDWDQYVSASVCDERFCGEDLEISLFWYKGRNQFRPPRSHCSAGFWWNSFFCLLLLQLCLSVSLDAWVFILVSQRPRVVCWHCPGMRNTMANGLQCDSHPALKVTPNVRKIKSPYPSFNVWLAKWNTFLSKKDLKNRCSSEARNIVLMTLKPLKTNLFSRFDNS